MTIACCYVASEGVVFGADSTTSYRGNDGYHYFNHAQKLFEIGGSDSTLAALTWGLGGLVGVSYRTLLAQLGDDLVARPPADFPDVMERFVDLFAMAVNFAAAPAIQAGFAVCRSLAGRPPFDPSQVVPNARTQAEEEQYQQLRRELTAGFCIGGRIAPDRTPSAYFVLFDPAVTARSVPVEIPLNSYRFWGAPNMVQRLIFGADEELLPEILKSGRWQGNQADLVALFQSKHLQHPVVPLREAVDFVHFCIHSTIKALKFSNFSQICGGPIELAVISSDRPFRWVHHKEWDAAIVDGALP